MHMSFAHDRTRVLWQGFMPRRHTLAKVSGPELYAVQLYPVPPTDQAFSGDTLFEKWAAVAVAPDAGMPEDMEVLQVREGWYIVWQYRGTPATAAEAFAYIFNEWLPQSGYALDCRPHFEVLGAAYRNDHPHSEEHIWIPVKPAVPDAAAIP